MAHCIHEGTMYREWPQEVTEESMNGINYKFYKKKISNMDANKIKYANMEENK